MIAQDFADSRPYDQAAVVETSAPQYYPYVSSKVASKGPEYSSLEAQCIPLRLTADLVLAVKIVHRVWARP